MEPIYGTFHDAETGGTITRELTEEEYAELLASGWTEEGTNDLA